MEKWKVVGFKIVNFVDQKTNVAVSGMRLFLARPGNDKITGLEVHSQWVSNHDLTQPYTPVENQMVTLYFNRYKKVTAVIPDEV